MFPFKKRTNTKNIVVNGRFLTQNLTGVQRYSLEISRHLKELNSDVCIVSPKNIKNKEAALLLKAKVIGRLRSHFWEQICLPLYLIRNGRPLLVNLGNSAPLCYSNQITAIHDTGFIENEKWYSRSFVFIYKNLIPLVIKRSRKIITVSEFSKSELLKNFKIKDSTIEIIQNGISNDFTTSKENLPPLMKGKYFLTVGTLSPRKNIELIIKAFLKLNKKELKLAIVGHIDSKIFGNTEIANLIKHSKNIVVFNQISDIELKSLYANTLGLVFMPFYEGFGLPVLEAAYFNKPVIISDIPVFRENFESFATFAPPNDYHQLAIEMQKLVDKHVSIKIPEGSNLLSKYSYKKGAKKLTAICDNLIQ